MSLAEEDGQVKMRPDSVTLFSLTGNKVQVELDVLSAGQGAAGDVAFV